MLTQQALDASNLADPLQLTNLQSSICRWMPPLDGTPSPTSRWMPPLDGTPFPTCRWMPPLDDTPSPNGLNANPSDYFEAKRPLGFLDLPGEVRNRIYQYVFEPKELAIHWLTPEKDLTFMIQESSSPTFEPGVWKCLQYRNFLSQRRSRISARGRFLGQQSIHGENDTLSPRLLPHRPAALLLTCRRVNVETTLMFYSSHALHFYSPKTIYRFLTNVPPASKAAIKKLRVHYSPTEAFYPSKDNGYKYGKDREWQKMCQKLALHMKGLEELTICFDVPLNGLSVFWRPGHRQLNPWMAFADGGLDHVRVYSNDDDELVQASLAVIRDLLRIRLVGFVSGGTGHLTDEIAHLEEHRADGHRCRSCFARDGFS